ncbi:hypothetical protein [Janthinobacterium agaricidamnosum]|uniref:Uncharacterized protein n=1 Tax=Janthinobacterium agaricidamnosum NBRC 102515 = DSM 9628 TaxID=1349767 RepID=W0V2Y5_9BURK|nr:hypothetical protein [Janthinobacterium agaricidamnosum]CDG83199.1 hypothetical protein GJA_2568 [Janthinobacterium agaricidamnosum NBRC 102515 = DSM 9628]
MSASFFGDAVTFTDLNGYSVVEVTVPYKMFCGGGIDTDAKGQTSLRYVANHWSRYPARRSLAVPAKATGVCHCLTLPEYAAFKKHLQTVWKKSLCQAILIRTSNNRLAKDEVSGKIRPQQTTAQKITIFFGENGTSYEEVTRKFKWLALNFLQ